MKLIIMIPCYNEAETLTVTLDALPKHIDGIDTIEYLIINDGSRDDTVEVAKRWGGSIISSISSRTGGWPEGLWQESMHACGMGRTLL